MEEIWSLTYEDQLLDPPPPQALPPNVLYTRREPPEFYLESPVEQARALFAAICPGEAFLPSEVPEGLLHLPRETEADDDEVLLEAALVDAERRRTVERRAGACASS